MTKQLEALDTSKAIGPDGIPTRILKDFARELAPSVTYLFNKSLLTGTVPAEWKLANIIPVFKKGDKSAPNNYRPISLLPVISKVLERCVYNKLILVLRDKITPKQFGFLAKRSTDAQLMSSFSDITNTIDAKQQVDMVFFDISKAFDSVPHRHLFLKLQTFGINGVLLKWFRNYLANRQQRVTLEGANSDWLPVGSGVPQGSILGPLQFIMYNNDLPNVISHGTEIAIFADDTKIYRTINTIRDCIILQNDINKIHQWD